MQPATPATFAQYQREGMTIVDIAKLTGCTEHHVRKGIMFDQLDPRIQTLMLEKKLTRDVAVLQALLDVPEHLRVDLALRLAGTSLTVSELVRACKHETVRVNQSKMTPAIALAARRANPNRVRADWRELLENGEVPEWAAIVRSARTACIACSLYDQDVTASACDDCPLVDFIRLLLETTHL